MSNKVTPLTDIAPQKDGAAIAADRKARETGKAARRLSMSHWHRTLVLVQCATAVYGGGAAPEGDEQPQVRELPTESPVPAQDEEPKNLSPIEDLRKMLREGTVLSSAMVTHHSTDTEAWLCAYRASSDPTLHILLSLRGTSSSEDAVTDLHFEKTEPQDGLARSAAGQGLLKRHALSPTVLAKIACHKGFYYQYRSVADRIAEQVGKMAALAGEGADWDLSISGHSMGGALARLAAFDLLGRGAAQKGQTRLCVIGSGPCGNAAFAETLDALLGVDDDCSRNLHIVNNNDPVPAVALSVIQGGAMCSAICGGGFSNADPFVHGGTLLWFGKAHDHILELGTGIIAGISRFSRRLLAYTCCCFTGMRFAVFDHGTDEYNVKICNKCRDLGLPVHSSFAKP